MTQAIQYGSHIGTVRDIHPGLMDGLPATVVPADHDRSLQVPHHQPRVYVSNRSNVAAVLDGLSHYHFLSTR